jgi:hypothetical protein
MHLRRLRVLLLSVVLMASSVARSDLAWSQSAEPPEAPTVQAIGDLRLIAERRLNDEVEAAALAGKGPLWAIGMPRGLDQEILVLDDSVHLGRFNGQRYRASIGSALPPVAFLIYARVERWRSIPIPSDVVSFQQIETFVAEAATEAGFASNQPFPFRIEADIASLRWFVVGGDGDGRPDPRASFLRERRLGPLSNRTISALGFYVPGERGILTNPSSNIHIHFTTRDKPRFVGHLDDEMSLAQGGKLLLPTP